MDLASLERHLILGGDREIVLPNWRNARYGAPLMLEQFLADLRSIAGTLLNVQGVVFFGSSVRVPRVIPKKFLFWSWAELEDIDANDIDVAVFVEREPRRLESSLRVRADDGFYGYYWKELRCLHYAALTEEIFAVALEEGDETACAIRREGVLFCGSAPVALKSRRRFEIIGSAISIGREDDTSNVRLAAEAQ